MFTVNGEKIALVTDTACDLSDGQLAEYDIRAVPLRVATTQGEFRDRVEIDPDTLYELMKTELPKTSLPLPGDVSAVFRELLAAGADRVVHLSISSGLSGACNMARLVADEFPEGAVRVYDTKTLSAGEGLLTLAAARCFSQGMGIDETFAQLDRLRAGQLGTFVIQTLEFLRKGGRIGLVEGVVGSLLNIKPVIFVNPDGVYQTLVKARGFTKARDAMANSFFERYAGKRVHLAIVHGHAPEEAAALHEHFLDHLNVVDSFISPVSPALAIHTGPGLLGAIVMEAE